MSEEKFVTKVCPSCNREVPATWDSCQFCGNVFRKSEPESNDCEMLRWGDEKSTEQ